MPTLAEILDLRARLSAELGRAIGVYPETKNPGYFADHGVPLGTRCWSTRCAAPVSTGPDAPVFVQSFDPASLRQLRTSSLRVPLVQLVDDDTPHLVTPTVSPRSRSTPTPWASTRTS